MLLKTKIKANVISKAFAFFCILLNIHFLFSPYLASASSTITHTSASDFDAGTFSSTVRTGSGDGASVILDTVPESTAQISSTSDHACAVKTNGTVYCWGSGDNGQLGNNATSDSNVPVQVHGSGDSGYLTGISQVSAGTYHTCALTNDGTVYCWGDNNYGELGDGTTNQSSTPVQVLDSDGSGFLSGVSQLSVDPIAGPTFTSHSCALKTDGTMYCWGGNTYGQLGDGTTDEAHIPVQVKSEDGLDNLTNVTQISAGRIYTCALKDDDTVDCWGNNQYGRLGDNTTSDRYLPTPVHGVNDTGYLSGISHVNAGINHTCAVGSGGNVYCWGNNSFGELGDNTTTERDTPVQVHGAGDSGFFSGAIEAPSGNIHTCAAKSDGSVYCWGDNQYGQIGDGSNNITYTPVQVVGFGGSGLLSNISSVQTGAVHSCALNTSGDVYCWGTNEQGQLGNGDNTNTNYPVQVSDLNLEVGGAGYEASGNYVSSSIDLGGTADFGNLDFTSQKPANTDIKFQVAANNDNATWDFVGSDGTASSYFTSTGTQIPTSLNGNRYVKYKAYLTSTDGVNTSSLDDITINYSVTAVASPDEPVTTEEDEDDYLKLTDSKNNQLTFDARIVKTKKQTSDPVGDDKKTRIKKISLTRENGKEIIGSFKVKNITPKSSNMKLPEKFNKKACLVYRYLEVSPDFERDKVKTADFYFKVAKSWIAQNKIISIDIINGTASSYKILNSKKTSSSSGNEIYKASSSSFSRFWDIVGCAKEQEALPVAPVSSPKPDSPSVPPTPIEEPVSVPEPSPISTPEPSVPSPAIPVQKPAGGAKETLTKVLGDYIEKNPGKLNAIKAAGISVPILLMLSQVSSISGLWNLFKEALDRIFGFLFPKRRKKKKDWGTIFDSLSGKPIPFTRVDLIDEKDGKVKDVKYTDKDGAFYFLAPPGSYRMEVEKRGYAVPPKESAAGDATSQVLYANMYDFSAINLAEPKIVNFNIPMIKRKRSWTDIFDRGFLYLVAGLVFWIALTINLAITIMIPSAINICILILYMAILAVTSIYFGKTHFGLVVNKKDMFQQFAVIKLLSLGSKQLIARTIADEGGRYFLIADPGDYLMEVTGRDGGTLQKQVRIMEKTVINETLKIE